MADYRFERECRTPYSEGYSILDGDDTVGRIDLHFTTASVYGALSVTEDIVMSADPYRTNCVVHVMQGREIGVFSDVDSEDDDDEEEEEDDSWDGRRP